jgi:DNA-binding winged helix-turn-helix (wHTH) protein/tetratricopeptide (TPR) repeat protein
VLVSPLSLSSAASSGPSDEAVISGSSVGAVRDTEVVAVHFDDVRLNRDAMQLERGGEAVAIEPQVFEVLAYLIEHRDRLVPKTELLDEIWGDRFVSESALSSRIKSARKAIGDNGRDQRLIRTVHGRGFRFVGEVHEVEGRRSGAASAAPAGRADDGYADDDLCDIVLEAVRSGTGMAVELIGPAGSKRRDRLDEVLHSAAKEGLLVGQGSAGSLRSFGSVLEAFDEWVQRRPELLDDMPEGCRRELERVLVGSEPTSQQRLFMSARELVAAAGRAGGAVMGIDDVHLIDRPTLDLLEHVARAVRRSSVALVVTHRPGFDLGPVTHTIMLDDPAGERSVDLPHTLRQPFAAAALVGGRFDPGSFEAAADLPPDLARRALEVGVADGILERVGDGFRFLDDELADRLASEVPPAERRAVHRRVAERLALDGAGAALVADQFIAAGDPEAAAEHQLAAARQAAGHQGHAEVLRRTEGIDGVGDPALRFELLCLRGDALAYSGDTECIRRYREALALAPPDAVPWLRGRLARGYMFAGDLDGAAEALEGVEPTGSREDGPILLVKAGVAYFRGEIDTAERFLELARPLAFEPGGPSQMLDVVALQGMISHSRGDWFDRLRREMSVTADSAIVGTVFDAHVCVAQYLLYGPTGREDVIRLANDLRAHASEQGSRRAEGFALTLAGEASLLSGDLEAARRYLSESVELHRSLRAETGEAHAMQRLAEVELASGDRGAAEGLCRRALPLTRWSPLARHLMQRCFGTLIAAAPSAEVALSFVDEAMQTLDEPTSCEFCQVTVDVPAAIACAVGGRLDEARVHVEAAANCAARWEGPAWPAAVTEARAVIAAAEGNAEDARSLFLEAARGFASAAQPLDEARCREAAEG